MIEETAIESAEASEIEPYRTMRRPLDHVTRGIFVAEGGFVVERLLASGLVVDSVLASEAWCQRLRPALVARPLATRVFIAQQHVLEEIVGFRLHQGVMAIGRVPHPEPLPDILARSRGPWLLVALDGVTNPENLGIIVRTCAAFGATAMIVGETGASPWLRRAVRNSMGTVFSLPVVHTDDLAAAIRQLRSGGVTVVGAHPRAEGKAVASVDATQDCCVVFGSEGDGISDQVREACDILVAVPMRRNVDSLNVASAAAVFLYEIDRQRRR